MENYPPYQATRPTRTSRLWPLVLMGLVGFAIARWIPWNQRPVHDPNAAPRPITPRGDLAADEKATIELFDTNVRSVAFITTSTVERDFFTGFKTSQGAGSGFIWDQNGHVVTNDHVIAGANFASVILADKSAWEARVIGRAPSKDLAVLQIDAPCGIASANCRWCIE